MTHENELVDGTERDWIDDHSESKVEFEPEMERMHEQDLTSRSEGDNLDDSRCRSD